MKRLSQVLTVLLSAIVCAVAVAGCSEPNKKEEEPPALVLESEKMNELLSTKKSDSLVYFGSSDNEFNDFLNDFAHRHLRYDEESVGNLTVADAASVMFEREWDSLALSWFDSASLPKNNLNLLKQWFSRVVVDKFGYVWSSDNVNVGDLTAGPVFFRQGWPFPTYKESLENAPGFEFNDSDLQGFTCNVEGATVQNGVYTFSSNKLTQDAVYENTTLNVNTVHSPFLELAIAVNKRSGADAANVDDLYVYWKRKGDADYSEERMVKQSEFATICEPIGESFSRTLFLPMYLHPMWGNDTDITAIKIVLRPQEGKTMKIRSRLNYLRFNYDTRQSANAALLLTAARNYYGFTHDYDDLKTNLNRYRSALQFMLTHLKGESGLLDLGYFAGHDGLVLDENYQRKLGHGIGDNYWDILSLPQINLSSNIYFYKAVCAMRDLEIMAERENIKIEKPQVKGADDWSADVKYTHDSASLTSLAELVKSRINEYFWNEKTGRLHIGYNMGDDNPVDFGYVVFNLEAIAEDILTGDKAKSVMDWISGKRIVESDTSKGADIYKFEFAPRTSTVRNNMQYVWPWIASNQPFGRQVQDGGSVLWASYYDIAARLKVYGANDAWARFKEINEWYKKVKAAGGSGRSFYRDYYDELWFEDKDFALQGGGKDGGLGLDEEFIESAILFAALPLGFMGLNGSADGVLTVSPNVPSQMSYFEVENLMFAGIKYDMVASRYSVGISSVRGTVQNEKVKIKFRVGEGYEILVDGEKVEASREGEFLTATVPFGKFVAEAVKA
ncbi:hypothetical protein [Pumilibacter muris]|uniref:hypothetical protein n=1 Tax=Pumilibacter muris TaxID=2941510 RepID=UPI0020422DAB|nr:hypothetical protein [Pumilibacter muris]